MKKTKFLIIGGDGLIGAAMSEAIQLQGGVVTTTSRYRHDTWKAPLFLDLQDEMSVLTLDVADYDVAYFCAGVSKYSDIEANVSLSRRINVTSTIHLCERLIKAGSSVVFLSTSAVFDGEHSYPGENDPVCPITCYGQQKHEVESALNPAIMMANTSGVVKIVRLSKVLTSKTPIINSWRNALSHGGVITPLLDLRLSPVSLPYVVAGLLRIGLLEQPGIFHLSGAQDVTYADIARELLIRWGYSLKLLRPVTSADSDIFLPYAPSHPSLGMDRTSEVVGIMPQPLQGCIADLINVA
ncbi:MAG: sugar nucleotide-binding protein [Gallionella sp.]|nr:sugar nucleotide-binding protein [Gallionella sp.]